MTKDNSKKVWVVIPAAGVGKRMQSELPKQYIKIHDKTILEHTINCFSQHPEIAGIVVAINFEDPYWNDLKIDTGSLPLYTVEGGAERSDSVSQALEYLSVVEQAAKDSWLMVHDAARPCLSQQDIDALLAIRETDAVGGILASPVRDTMKRGDEAQLITHTESRDNLWHALTPQMFRLGQLQDAFQHCLDKNITITDESSALEAIGEKPKLVEGSSTNIKVTQPADLDLATWLLSKNGANNA